MGNISSKNSREKPSSTTSIDILCHGLYPKCKYLVIGFVRINSSGIHIPFDIINICHDFFHQSEKWFPGSKYVQNNSISIENHTMCIHNKEHSWNSIFGSFIVSMQSLPVVTWKFKVCGVASSCTYEGNVFFGVTVNDEPQWKTTHWIGGDHAYSFYNEGSAPYLWANSHRGKKLDNKFIFSKVGQELTMTLDLKKKTLNFNTNGEYAGGHQNIDNSKKYRMGVSFYAGINKIKLVPY